MVFVSGMPPFDPETGEILVHAPFERQVELIESGGRVVQETRSWNAAEGRTFSMRSPPNVAISRRTLPRNQGRQRR